MSSLNDGHVAPPSNLGPEMGDADHASQMPSPQPTTGREGFPDPAEKGSKEPHPATHVHIAPNLGDLVSEVFVPFEERNRAREQQRLDRTIHAVLIIGLVAGVLFMMVGLLLNLFLSRDVAAAVPTLRDVTARVLSLRPSGFFALGILMLIATPVMGVIGSIVAFVRERDWSYAGITFLVFLIIALSVVLGRG